MGHTQGLMSAMRAEAACEAQSAELIGGGTEALTPLCDCARLCRAESLQVEIGCRQEEEDVAVDIDIKTASQKSLAKVVNQV
jgi:hypothetical protein